MDNKKKNLISIEGFITAMTEPVVIKLSDGKKFTQAIATFEQTDGQKAYFEVRQKIIEQFKASDIKPDTEVRIGFVMLGVQKGVNLFNKIYINKLELV